ncbi:MAG: hypothetical protein UX80_C0003G0031 [Candidatus Amesbacteria bacterium GW2011_GWA2_47_11b]|uniref:LytR/CpsA/Psr regulator C-terminal domain-containing protein n=3 Tax=Candidatus Amesiibacteriota TaxID=1752730 RepID=A0A0G1SLB2_9BACT|nr:MAG: hypothetical protein UX42_C0014G0017 [Microgenomates group bacterium GW2011_GWC1_46_20]KKU58376.1 MAG: hypothetical protein UX80_C0003G0031 [Candidatus Amesbacteria bacterium GW2011_GWA2_47_11b]KKU70196.1 MAG: hypothetical protein UX92_C0003G0016 [Candidatus Amesbacteria bacterium GW2011_GWA1_47_20]KKU83114.1 MAG: hypothetical protein UY11_C0028G0008 [Candidatus Amesbacteria bacterium GW2011_GWC2_47_8]
MKKTIPTIVSVSRGGLSVCGAQINGLLKMPFGVEMVKDLNVVGLAELTAQIKKFVETNKISVSDLVVVLDAETYFERQLTGGTDEKMAEEVQEFVDSVPLASLSSKVFKANGKYHVVVINRRLYESVRTAFESLGFVVKAVVPELVLGVVGVGSTFDTNACRLILKKMGYVMENSFVGVTHVHTDDESWVNKNQKTATIMAVGAIMVAVLGVGLVAWQTISARQAAVARAKARQTRVVQISPSPTPTPATVVLTMRVVNATGVAGEAQKVRDDLVRLGFANIETATGAKTDKTLTVFSPRVSQADRQKVLAVVGGTSRENTQSQFDVLITLGQVTP